MTIESAQDLHGLLTVGRIVGQTLEYMREQVQPGMTTRELDEQARRFLQRHRARSAPLITYQFPGTTCISINEEAAHGIPGERVIQAGDLVKLDVSAEHNGYFADAAITVAVPPASAEQQRLCRCAQEALSAAIAAVRAGQPLSVMGRAAERVARQYSYHIVRDLHGHGVGRGLHEAPANIPQYADPSATQRLRDGLVLTVEPHIATRAGQTRTAPNGWTLSTKAGSYVAMYEHTIIVTRDQPIIVTAL